MNAETLQELLSFLYAECCTRSRVAEPVKLKPEPALNLTLNYEGAVKDRGALNHLGIQVRSTEAVLEAKRRLERAGLATFDEMDTDCCHALQDKIWVSDPNGYRWEVFVVKVGTRRRS